MQKGKTPKVSGVAGKVGTWETRIRFGEGRRRRFLICHCRSREAALERALSMIEIAEILVEAGRISEVEAVLCAAGAAENSAKLAAVRNLARRISQGHYEGPAARRTSISESITLREFATLWCDGALAEMWPDHIDPKKTAQDDLWRLQKHVFPLVGQVRVREFTLDDADRVMSSLPKTLARASRRHVAQVLVRLLHIATYPARLRSATPIPRGWLPKLRGKVAYPILLRGEDAALLATTTVPLWRRLIYGLLHREGIRRGDVECLRWRQLDLVLGTLRVEADKTDHARLFKLDRGVVAALTQWQDLHSSPKSHEFVFAVSDGKVPRLDQLAEQLRNDLKRAGVTRQELFESHGNWGRLNAHTLRHSYVTRSLARGVPEDTVRQHTGHVSNELRRYREAARSFAEIELEDLVPLDEAIPEFANVGQKVGHNVGQVEKRGSEEH